MIAIGSQRDLFDIPEGVAYFNTAYNGPLLNAARTRLVDAAGSKSRPWERQPRDFFEDADTLRGLADRLFGGGADGWAVVPAASYGLSAAARALEPAFKPGDRVLVMAEEFPSNVLPWRSALKSARGAVETVPAPADGDWTTAVLEALTSGIRVAALSHTRWTDGARLDLAAIGARCREVGAALVIDATQSLGAAPLDLAAVDPDFVVAAGYKWLLCPYGFALMYVAPRQRRARPLEETWLARAGAEDFAGLVNYSEAYRPGARRFDGGETCVPTVLAGAVATLEQLARWGVEPISATLSAINGRIAARLEGLGFRIPPASQRSPHMFGASTPEGYAGDLAADLRARGVHISRRGQSARFAPHLHVTEADLAQLFAGLDDIFGRPQSRAKAPVKPLKRTSWPGLSRP